MKDGGGAESEDPPMYGVDFEWRGDDLVPSERKPSMDHDPEGSALRIAVFEVRDPTPEARERMQMPPGDVVCQIVILNLRTARSGRGRPLVDADPGELCSVSRVDTGRRR